MDLHFVGTANVFVYYPYWPENRERELDIEPPHEGRRRQVPAAIDPVARRRRQAKR